MLTTSFTWLAVFGPALSWASPVAIPEDQSALEKRTSDYDNLDEYFPDCAKDPSYAPDSQFKDGEGTYVSTSCTSGHGSSHCWTDYYVVNQQATYSAWENSGQVIDCSTTSTCSEVSMNLNSSCTTAATTWDNTIGGDVQAKFNLWFSGGEGSASLKYDHSFGGGKYVQICGSTSDSGTCTWSDKNCHAIWVAQRNLHVTGYMRRSCVAPRPNTQIPKAQQTKRPDGYYTVGIMDVGINVPKNRFIGCAADCGDLNYPDPTPGNGAVTPFPPAGA